MNLIFLGLPGSGKGTVAKMLPQFTQISTGDLLRKERDSGSPLGKEIAKLIDAGNLVSDELALQTIESNIKDPSKQYLFDGFPRTVTQAKMLDPLLGDNYQVVLFDIDKNKLIDRLVNRRTCPKCGEIYNLLTKKPKVDNCCDVCNHQGLKHREDDKLEVLDKRFSIFEKEASAIVDFYKQKNKLVTIDADGSSDVVFSEFKKLLKI